MSAMQSLTVAEYAFDDVPEHLSGYADSDGLLIEATVWADMERNDYGVPGSPVWYEATVTSVEVEVNGVNLPICPDDLYELAAEAAIERGEWED
jgi:hypothetical protein